MTNQRKKTGALGEAIAAQHLIEQGYEIIAKNWRCAEGELDLVAKIEGDLVFVEVRTRIGQRLGSPEESITRTKQEKLIQLAYAFLDTYQGPDYPWRIDVIAVVLNGQRQVVRLNHIEYAVGEDF
ncbi:MAG: YraN family protein [Chloroflexota bacterium]